MGSPRIVYRPRPGISPSDERIILANAYSYLLRCHERKKTTELTREPDDQDDVLSIESAEEVSDVNL
jgi:hypothetical protein